MKNIFFVVLMSTVIFARAQARPYREVYPLSVEVCALSQASNSEPRTGISWGHSVLLLHGACRDKEAGFPRLVSCPEVPNAAVVVSVNSMLRNAHWVANEGESFIFSGLLGEKDSLNTNVFKATAEDLLQKNVFAGLTTRPPPFRTIKVPVYQEPHEDPAVLLSRSAVGLDVALTYNHEVYCARLPVTKEILQRVVDYLNADNAQYLSGHKEFTWSFYANNCAHMTNNALAAIGVLDSKRTDSNPFFQFAGNLAIPSHVFIEMMHQGNVRHFPKAREVYRNREWRDLVLTQSWLPVRPGVISRVLPIHRPNELYLEALDLFILDRPGGPYKKAFAAYTTDPLYRDLQQNLKNFRALYKEALAAVGPGSSATSKDVNLETISFSQFVPYYRAYLQKELSSLDEELSKWN